MSRRPLALLALTALLAASAGCGARWSDDERAELISRNRDAASKTTRSSTGVTTPGATREAGPAAVGQPEPATAADVDAGSGSTQAFGGVTGGPLPCTAPSDAPGVSDDELRVGSISSLSGPVPGLGGSSAAAARAYVAYRNSTGGVCGRKVVLREGDDGTEGARYRALATDLSQNVLGIVGGFALGDVGGLDVIEAQKLPVVNVPSDDQGTAVSTLFDLNPPFEDPDAVVGKYRYLYEQGVRTATSAYLAVAQSRLEAQRQQRLMEAAGIRVVQVEELPISTLSYDSAARAVANSGADYLFFIGDALGNAGMARAVEDTGYSLKFAEYFTFAYGAGFLELAGPAAAEGATSWIRTLPNEEAGSNQEMARFLQWMDRAAPGVVKDVFAADSWAAAKVFFESLEALAGPISRAALVDQLRSVGTYDAGGMLGPIRLGAELTNGCVIGMRVEGGAWTRMSPADGFLC